MDTTLRVLREYPGWQDKGQVGEDDGLTDDLVVTISPDGSVGVCGDVGVLVYADNVSASWVAFLFDQGLIE